MMGFIIWWNQVWIRLCIWTHFARCVSCLSSFWNRKTEPKQETNLKTKSRALQLHFGTNLSIKLQIVFENGTLEVENHDFVLPRKWKCFECGEWLRTELHPPMSSISTFELTQNHDVQLQVYRSRRLFGVWCSDWYQNEAEELYFSFLYLFFVLVHFFGFKNSKDTTHIEQNESKYTIWSTSGFTK